MDLVASELRRLRRQVVDLNRRLALARVPGTIEEIDTGKRMVRVKIGEDAEGQPILSPWVRWEEQAGNALLKVHVPPVKGARVNLESPSGTIGEGSVASWSTYHDANAAPSQSADTAMLAASTSQIEMKDGEIFIRTASKLTLEVAGSTIEMLPAKVTVKADEIVTDGTTKVGSPDANRQIHFVSGLDSGGDAAVDGSSKALV